MTHEQERTFADMLARIAVLESQVAVLQSVTTLPLNYPSIFKLGSIAGGLRIELPPAEA